MRSVWLVLAATVCAAVAAAAAPPGIAATGARDAAAKRPLGSTVRSAKLDSTLAQVAGAERQNGAGAAKARSLGLAVKDGRVLVVVVPRTTPSAAESAVAVAGGEVVATYAGLVQALVSPSALEPLAASAAIAYMRPPNRPIPQAVTGEEISRSGAATFHTVGWTGTGVKVAIIDAGFVGLAARQAAGDIPMGVTTQDFCGGGFNSITEHGAAVTEIVHEVAPGAQLYLLCVNSEVTLGQAKDYAKANGIVIVNQSLAWLNAGRGDGSGGPATVDGIVADARANGILWVNSAGNYQQRHWSGNFNGGGGAAIVHDFAPGDERNTLSVGAGQQTCAFLKWDDWPGSAQDYDLYLVRESDGVTVAGSAGFQTGSQAPTEGFCYTVPGGLGGNYGLEIEVFDATAAPRFDLITTFPNLEYRTQAGSIIEPASSPNAMAVGALCWNDGSLRDFSSLGPTIDGRTKPDIAGLDGVSGGTYGNASSPCSLGVFGNGFPGTSASSPHVAGLAALGKQQNPALTPAQLQTWLEARALDVWTTGKDNFTGSGQAYVYTFTDAPPWGPFQLFIEQIFKKGTTTGCSGLNPATGVRLYCPFNPVTRAEMSVFIVNSAGLTPFNNPTPTFADVPLGAFAYGHIERMFQQNITGGCAVSPLRFCPTNPVTRASMAVFIVKAKGLTELNNPTATFADVPLGSFAYGFIERMFEQNITGGCAVSPLRYCPFDAVTRGQMAVFLIRAFGP